MSEQSAPTSEAQPATATETSAPSTDTPETFSRADVEAILAADRREREAALSPVDRFRRAVRPTPTATAPNAPAQGESSIDRVARLMEMQLTAQLAHAMPKPPAPPKPLSPTEKLTSDDPTVWLTRGGVPSPNQWSSDDQRALVEQHEAKLVAEGFRGNAHHEARMRAAREIAHAVGKVFAKTKVRPL